MLFGEGELFVEEGFVWGRVFAGVVLGEEVEDGEALGLGAGGGLED